MNILVIGSKGFIGSHLVDALCQQSQDNIVYGLARSAQHNREVCVRENFVPIQADLLDSNLASKLPLRIDFIYSLVAGYSLEKGYQSPEEAFQVNVLGTQRLLDIARQKQGKGVIFTSSAYVYGNNSQLPCYEEMPPAPDSPLGVTKLAAECICNAYWICYRLPCIALRIFTVYGPRQRDLQFVTSAFKKIMRAIDVAEFGSPASTRDFIYVDDVIKVLLQAGVYLSENPTFDVFNVGTGRETRIDEIVNLMTKIAGKEEVNCRFDQLPHQTGKVTRHQACIEKAHNFLNWAPQIELEDGLRRTFNYLLQHIGDDNEF